ncbi:glycosyltransferase family 2 protein [Rhodospirillum sp. A1_3_36]|uniref:glycosyltransferase family 2 protein n=1 Tax=Rhodospirillum sp. A1_3_36 TaxID=3391666 RepID=UPI0039A4D8D9
MVETEDRPWLSAIVPNYNDAATLSQAVRALASQAPPPDEILVVDDGSTDNSLAVIERLQSEMPSLLLLRNRRNLGVIPALNRGLEAARGRYIYMGSANDWVEPGFFAAARRMLEAHPTSGFFVGECRIVDMEGRPFAMRPVARPAQHACTVPAAAAPGVLRRIDNFIPSSSVVLRRDAAEALGFLDPTLGSFADGYLMRAVALRYGFCFAPLIAANWTLDRTGASLTTATRAASAVAILDAALAKMRTDPHFPPDYLPLFARRWRFGVGRINAGANRTILLELQSLVAPTPSDSAIWRLLAYVPGGLGKVLRMIWLTLRFRPFAWPPLLATQLTRAWARRAKSRSQQKSVA